MLHDLMYRLRILFGRKKADSELEEELAYHLERQAEKLKQAGVPSDEAMRQAHLKLGSPTQVRETIRRAESVEWLANLARDARYGLRTLRRNPGYALVAVLTLGLGIGANTAIFTVIDGVLLRPLPYAHADQIVHLDQVAKRVGPDQLGLSVKEYEDYRDQNRSFSDVAEYHSMLFTLLGTKDPVRVATGVVSANYFDVMGVKPELGRLLTAKDEVQGAPPVLVLSHAFWLKEFGGDKSVIGRSLEMNDRVHTVIGALPALPDYPDANDVYMPTTSCPYRMNRKVINNRFLRMITAYARLKPGVTLAQAQADTAMIADRMTDTWAQGRAMGFAAEVAPIDTELTHAARPTFLMLLAAAGLVLLLACANMANLALSRQMRRSRELAVRMATGASAWRLFRQMLVESVLVSLAGGVVGVAIAAAGTHLLATYASRLTPLSGGIHLGAGVLLFALGISLLTGVLFGAVPGYIASRVQLTSLTATGERTTGNEVATRLRGVFVAVQVGLSFVLLLCAGLMMRSLYNLLSVDPGFKTANVLSMQLSLNWTKYDSMTKENMFYREILDRVDTLPGVEAASFSWAAPLSGVEPMNGGVLVDGQQHRPDKVMPQVDFEVASPDYFRVLDVPVLSGRGFTEADRLDAPLVAMVNTRMAQHFWPHESPIGHHISDDQGKTWRMVVGVVGNIHQYQLETKPKDAVYVPLDQHSLGNAHLLVRTRANPLQMASEITSVIHGVDPQQPVAEAHTLDQLRNAQLGTPRVTAMLLGVFALVALFITAVGVTGTLALSVARRSKEIGIRMALGATKKSILRHVLLRGLVPVFAGLAVGVAGSFFATRLLTHLLFAVSPDDPRTFAGIALLLLAVAVAGCLVPARRAVKIDPMTALRME